MIGNFDPMISNENLMSLRAFQCGLLISMFRNHQLSLVLHYVFSLVVFGAKNRKNLLLSPALEGNGSLWRGGGC